MKEKEREKNPYVLMKLKEVWPILTCKIEPDANSGTLQGKNI